MRVPFLDLKTQSKSVMADILPLWTEILNTAEFVGGKHIIGFEEEFARNCSVKHCITVGSGTDALRFILIGLGIKAGDEVITVPNTFIATTEAISQAGGNIIFVDIDPNTYNLDPSKIEAAITPKTKGIVTVHLYGQPADMDPILEIAEKHHLWVVEDACQAHLSEYKGKRAGSLGKAAAFSFYPGKNLGACGEAGAVTTNDTELAARIRRIRDHGQRAKYHHDIEGYNGRCDAIQAAALRVKLKHLPAWNEARRKNAHCYRINLQDNPQILLPKIIPDCLPVFHLYVVQIENRDQVKDALAELQISTGLHYPVPLHLQKAYSPMKLKKKCFPVTEKSAEMLLSLPMFPELTEDQISYVCECLKKIFRKF